MIFYKHFIGDFIAKTRHLSILERGAYRDLLEHYYSTERPLPRDVETLCRIVGARGENECAAVARVSEEFFTLDEDGLRHNRRADEEIEHAWSKSTKASKAAKHRWGHA